MSTNQELIAEARMTVGANPPFHGHNIDLIAALADALESLQSERDAEMLRVKACEHIAEGDEGWEALQNECPSTAAVAALRRKYEQLEARLLEEMNRPAANNCAALALVEGKEEQV